ncbi:MAG TPA: maleylpyruvate isomerase family mycothiol-dependent enzyme [Streptosporangiaceae bacterium]|nr:maleylpyruvate isomerase family mycothiol-dependent enzyme [Streptosporangiaceae bacterium]
MSNADAVIAALRSGYDSLASRVSEFGDDDLARPSGAAEWDVAQVLSHLGSGAEISRATVQAALDGEPNPGADFNHAVWDKWNAMTRREQASGFLSANQVLLGLLESLDASTRDTLRVDMSFLPAPVDVATVARLRLNEFTLHSWDIRVVSDPDATLPADATAELLHGEPNLIGWIGKADPLNGREAAVAVSTTEPASVFALRLRAPISVDFDIPDEPDGTLTLPAEAWLRLVAGRLAPRHTPASVAAAGAADLGLLRQVFPGY